MSNTEDGAGEAGAAGIERWWPHLSIPAKHRLLADLDAALDAQTVDEIETITGGTAPTRLSPAERDFVRTQVEAVD
ncbi:hypothetical protein DCE93_04345 [Agromyces badenianii]|uniref:Uncharacterized protein n=1 Tax=Agromyces badenianii TaxID=2080742 RepID=A0A2S0WUG4_9MICO|nr:hypothetical protein [Agromyces badenianii]AWB94985.1 hypothetical protein DCE93_04345 [Agromyces badenianii]PWC03051.1 hypothetical protein DCE94_12245 [Agromyces badenianii]